jgi:hypothetical protein
MLRLEKWSVITDDSNPFLAPELRKMRLQGEVYDRSDFEDGTFVHTSSIQRLDIKNNLAETRNTEYQLGEPSEDYLKWLESNGKRLEDYVVE